MHFLSLDVLYAPWLPDLYFWWKSCILYSRFYGIAKKLYEQVLIAYDITLQV